MHIVLIALVLTLFGCGAGGTSAGPPVDSPQWYWQGAVESFQAGDFGETIEYLDGLADKDDPLAAEAVIWRAVLTAGLAQAHLEIANAAREGIRKKPGSAAVLRTWMRNASRKGRQFAFDLAGDLPAIDQALGEDAFALRFPYPPGSPGQSPVIHAVNNGNPATKAQMETAVAHSERRHVILTLAQAAGAADAAGSQALFASGPVAAPPARMRLALAQSMGDMAFLLRANLLNDPKLRPVLLERAEAWAASAAATSDSDISSAARELRGKLRNEKRVD